MPLPSVHEPPANRNEIFDAWLANQGPLVPQQEHGAAARLFTGALTTIPRAVEGISMSAATLGRLAGMTSGTGRFLPEDINLPPGQGLGQQAADLAAGLMPLIPEFALTGGLGRQVATAANLGPRMSRVASEAINFGALGLQHDALTGLEQTGEGAAIGAITSSMVKTDPRRWLAAGALGLGSKAFFDWHGGGGNVFGGMSQGDIAGWANTLSTILIGKPMMGANTTKVPTPGKFHQSNSPGAIPTKVQEQAQYEQLMGGARAPAAPRVPASMAYGDVLGVFPREQAAYQQYRENVPSMENLIRKRMEAEVEMNRYHAMVQQGLAQQGPPPLPVATVANLGEQITGNLGALRDPLTGQPVPNRALRSTAQESAEAMQQIWAQRGEPPLPTGNPDLDALLGIRAPVTGEAEAIAQRMIAERAKADKQVQLEFFREERRPQIEAYLAQRLAKSQAAKAARINDPLQLDPRELFHPANMDQLTQMAARGNPEAEALMRQIQAELMSQQVGPVPMQMSPLAEGGIVGAPKGKIQPLSQAEAQGLPGQIKSKAEAAIEAEREAGRRSKLDFSPIPMWRRHEGGFTDLDTMLGITRMGAQGVLGATAGKLAASQTPDPDDEAAMMLYFAAAGMSPQLARVAMAGMQKLRGRQGRPGFKETGSIPAGAGPGDSAVNADLLRKIDEGKVIYDGEGTIRPGTHQFTIEDPTLAAHGQTFYVIGEVTPDKFAKAYNDTVARYQPAQPAPGMHSNPQWGPESGGIANPFGSGGSMPKGMRLEVEDFKEPKRPKSPMGGEYVAVHVKTAHGSYVGTVSAQIKGKYLQVRETNLDWDLRGQKFGLAMYDRLIDEAQKRGLTLTSDTIVSGDAIRVYEALERRGYKVTMSDAANKDGNYRMTGDGTPVYTVEPPVATVAKPIDAEPPKLWHVTSEGNWKKIDKQGLRPLQTSNFRQGSATGARYGGGEVYAFDNFDDAVRWAAKMDWDATSSWGSGKFRIVEFGKKGEHWMVDTADPLAQSSAKGKWWKQMAGIKREEITNSYVFDDALANRMREKEIIPPSEKTGGMKRGPQYGKQREGGFVMPELTAALGRGFIGAGIGGFAGGLIDPVGEHGNMVLGGMIGAAALMFGPAMARATAARLGGIKTVPSKSTKGIDWGNIRASLGQKIEEHAGAVISRSSVKVSDRFIRWVDQAGELTMPIAVKRVLAEARGAASVLLDNLDSSLMQVALRYKPSQVVKDITNKFLDSGDDVAFLQALQPHIANDPQIRNYATLMLTGRQTVTGLQKMVLEGINDPKLKQKIHDSLDKYLTRSYRIFTNPHWKPNEASMLAVTDEILRHNAMPGASKDSIMAALRQYVEEVKTAKGVYNVRQGSIISQQVLKDRKNISQAWKTFLGEITDPTERVYQTVFRLRPMAEGARYFASVAKVEDQGLPQAFKSYADKDIFQVQLKQKLQNPSLTQVERDLIDQQLTRLDSYVNVDSHQKFGALSGNVVSRHVWNTLKTWDSLTDPMHHPLLRGVVNAHTHIKLMRTAFNPLTVIRNFMSMPVFMAIGRAGIKDVAEGWDIIRNPNHPLRQEIMRQGIGNVDQVKTEFLKEFDSLTGSKYNFGEIDMTNLGMGRFDLDIAEIVARRGVRKILDYYRLPDNAVRIGAYLSAKRRIAEELGHGMDHPDVIKAATDFTNRYTMNYDAVAPVIKLFRQLPTANLFLSYTAEMARIGKNLAWDVIEGQKSVGGLSGISRHNRMYAMLPLSTLALLPEMLESSSEDALSPKDKEDWEKAKKLMPDYSRTRFRYVTGRDPKTKQFHYVDFTPLIASDSFNQMGRAIEKGDWAALASVNPVISWDNTPLLNIAVEQYQGKESHTYREFRGGADRIAAIAKEVLPPWFPGGTEFERGTRAHATTAEGELGLTNMKTGVRITPTDFWSSYFGPLTGKMTLPGSRVGSVNLQLLQQRIQQETKSQLANEVAYLNDVLKTDAPDDIKQRAIDKFKLTVANLRENYRAKLGVNE